MRKEKILFVLILLVSLFGLAACTSDEDEAVEEFPNWQTTNSTYWSNMLSETRKKISQGDKSWRILPSYALEESIVTVPDDRCVIVHELEKGDGTENPLFSDTVRINYTGRLLPSTTYKEGLVFESTWSEKHNPETSAPVKVVVSGLVEGMTTVLQQMHVGDRWAIYIPWQMGYGVNPPTNSGIPNYSMLIFDLSLMESWHPVKK